MANHPAMRLPKSAMRYELRRHIERQAREIEQLRHSTDIASSFISQLKADYQHERNQKEGFQFEVKQLKQSPKAQASSSSSSSKRLRTETAQRSVVAVPPSSPPSPSPPASPTVTHLQSSPLAERHQIEHLSPLKRHQQEQLKPTGVCFRCRQHVHRSYDSCCPNVNWRARSRSQSLSTPSQSSFEGAPAQNVNWRAKPRTQSLSSDTAPAPKKQRTQKTSQKKQIEQIEQMAQRIEKLEQQSVKNQQQSFQPLVCEPGTTACFMRKSVSHPAVDSPAVIPPAVSPPAVSPPAVNPLAVSP